MESVSYYNRAVKKYDPELYAKRDDDGFISVYRNGKRWAVYDVDGTEVAFLIPSPTFVFALTDNWSKTGQPRNWGQDRVLERLRDIDAWARKDLLRELEEKEELIEESRARSLRNEAEAFWADNRRQFAKATDGILTHSLDKTEKKRRIQDANRERKQRRF
jgi:hypothetical protein